jgi:hypothetical protein
MPLFRCWDACWEADAHTTLDIDDAALAGAMQFSEGRHRTTVVNEALRDDARR